MTAIDRYHDARRASDTATAQAMDTLQLALTVLVEVPRYRAEELAADRGVAPDQGLSANEIKELEAHRDEMLRLARLYADRRLVDYVATDQIIQRLSDGLA